MKLFITICALLLTVRAQAQFDSLRLEVGTIATYATEDYQPLGSLTRRFGMVSDQKYDASSFVKFENTNKLGSNFSVNYGVSLFNNNQFKDVFIQEGFVKFNYKKLHLLAGREETTTGDINHELSSGSLALSNNARPIPQIRLMSDYINIPFTDSLFQFKFSVSHGWMEKNRIIQNPFLHEKSFYLKIGREKLNFYGGLIHNALWSGVSPDGQMPNRFSDFLRITMGAPQADDGTFTGVAQNTNNALGSHMLVFDLGININNQIGSIKLYTQSIFEKGTGSRTGRDKIRGFDLLTRDRLLGASLANNDKEGFLQNITAEFLYTKYQGGEEIFVGRDNYYNNAIYTSGWTYQGRILGTPLFLNQERAARYFEDSRNLANSEIVNNRIIAAHTGIKLRISNNIFTKTIATYTWNYGNYDNESAFAPVNKQLYLLQEINWKVSNTLTLDLGLAIDRGDMTNNLGGLIGVAYRIL